MGGDTEGTVVLSTSHFSLAHSSSLLFTRKTIFLFWRVTIPSIDFTDLVTWQKM